MSQFNHTLSAILRGRWLIDSHWAMAHFPMVVSLLEGRPVSFIERSGQAEYERPFAVDPKTMKRFEMYAYDGNGRYVPNPNIPPDSVAVIPFNGPLTKYSGDCGEPGMISRYNWLTDALQRNHICGVIQLMDTPGGESRAAHTYSQALLKSGKPIVSFVDDMCCSLGVWLSAPSREIYASNELIDFGSVGTMCSIWDYTGWLEKAGIKVHEFYAPQSTDKNKDYRDVISGNPEGQKAIEEDLGIYNAEFIRFVSQMRPKAKPNQSAWDSGKVFHAAEAKKIGLIDGIMSFEQVVSRVVWLSKK